MDSINRVLPESGRGFRTYNREAGGADQYGLPETIDFLVELGDDWAGEHEVPFQVGDISRRGGGPFPPHAGHRRGNEVDVRPFRRDGEMEPVHYFDLAYDQERTRDFIEAVKERAPRTIVLFNDPQLVAEGLTREWSGHWDHMHVRLPFSAADEQNALGGPAAAEQADNLVASRTRGACER